MFWGKCSASLLRGTGWRRGRIRVFGRSRHCAAWWPLAPHLRQDKTAFAQLLGSGARRSPRAANCDPCPCLSGFPCPCGWRWRWCCRAVVIDGNNGQEASRQFPVLKPAASIQVGSKCLVIGLHTAGPFWADLGSMLPHLDSMSAHLKHVVQSWPDVGPKKDET